MTTTAERETLRVDVPVGFLLAEEQEVEVWVQRPGSAGPLAVRLKLKPAVPSWQRFDEQDEF